MSAEVLSSLMGQDVSTSGHGTFTLPVEHLDYGYIEKCSDVKYLEKILKVLRSGDEGIYPHLIQFCENHLERLNPKSHALRKENPVATAASLSKDEWSQLTDELKTWETEAKGIEKELDKQSVFPDIQNLPPTPVLKGLKKSSKMVAPREYRE